jgi:hypothetical protein
VTIHVTPDGATWRTADLLGHYVAVGSPTPTWRECVEGYVYDAGAWRLLFAVQPEVPTNFRATNVGAQINSVRLEWAAAARATSYKLYYRVGTTGALNHFATTSNLFWDAGSMGYDINHEFWIEAIDSGGRPSKTMAGPVRVRSGHAEQAIPAGSANTGLQDFNSWANWRQGQWGYGGTLLMGWYTTESYRYHLFFELNWAHMRNVIAAITPQLNGYWWNITCNGAEIHIDRNGTSGNHGTAYNVEVQLGNGISYGNAAEPGNQGNVTGFRMPANAEGRVAVGMPANWFTAIYQQHSAYNGFLWRAYTTAGARQPYIGVEANAKWAMNYYWPKIVTVAQVNTAAW